MEGVFLDARMIDGGVELLVAVDNGLIRVRVPQDYRLYLCPQNGLDATRLAKGLEAPGLSSWVEDWFKPPWYNARCSIVVASSRDPRLLERVYHGLKARGVARRVNQYPGMLVEALWRLGVPPGTRIRINGGVSVLEDVDDPLYDPPPIRTAFLEAYSWHGGLAIPWEKPDYYIVECCGVRERLGDPQGVIDFLAMHNPHIIIARLEARYTLPYTGDWLWFDPSRSLVSIWGLVEWMRISWLPFHMANQAPIGKVLTSAEALEAYRRRYLVDPEASRIESFRSLSRLVESDMAGASRIPVPGLYWNVYQLDYSSLYPGLISIHNISPETVWRPECSRVEVAPQVGHEICLDSPGLVPVVLGRLVMRRRIIKESGVGDPRIRERADAIKWILVSGFGYLGYRNSLFGSITAYESVTAYARNALMIAEEESESAGYRLIHSIIDSVFIQASEPRIGIVELMDRIRRRVGIPLKLEARYRWLYIPPTIRGPGAVNKYYGALTSGGVKIRGILAVRRDTPPLIARVQRAGIMLLAGARGPREFYSILERVHELFDRVKGFILSGRVPPSLLVITRRLTYPVRRPQSYRRGLDDEGLILDTVKYVMTDRGPRPVWEGPPPSYDASYYAGVLERARRELPYV